MSFAILCRGEPCFKRHFSVFIHSALIACSKVSGILDLENGQGRHFTRVDCLAFFGMRFALPVRAIDICSINASFRCNREALLSPVPMPVCTTRLHAVSHRLEATLFPSPICKAGLIVGADKITVSFESKSVVSTAFVAPIKSLIRCKKVIATCGPIAMCSINHACATLRICVRENLFAFKAACWLNCCMMRAASLPLPLWVIDHRRMWSEETRLQNAVAGRLLTASSRFATSSSNSNATTFSPG